jgi:tRNA threonylcarbamoyladenosine biosynthesis protein TsaE
MSSPEFQFVAEDESQTQSLGLGIAAALQSGDVVGLVGNLGAGKTRLVKAIAGGLGTNPDEVTSPTFVLIQEYAGRLNLYHFDTYRLADSDEFLELGADELLYGDGVCIVEWSDRVADVLPDDILRIQIEHVGETIRHFKFRASGRRSAELLRQIAATSSGNA